MTENKPSPKNPATPAQVENTVDNPTESFEQPERMTGGSTPRPPAGYFTDPSPTPVRDPAVGDPAVDSETPEHQNPTAAERPARHHARVGTIVWGGVVLVAGILLILATQVDLDLDAGLTTMWLLLGAGVAMVAGGAVNLLRRKQP